MLDKTSFPEKLQKLIVDIVTKAKDFLFVRVEAQAQRQLSEGERVAREERQLARYGRTYRVGLHTQIHDMREKIDILQSREAECKKYQLFVAMIETEVLKVRAGRDLSLVVPQKPHADIGNSALIKNVDVVKEKLPQEQAPQKSQPIEKESGLQKDFAKAQMPIKDESGHKPWVKAERETQVPILSQPQTLPRQDSKIDPATTAKTKTDVTAVDYKDGVAQSASSKVSAEYRIPANAQTQKMLDKIQVELKEIKAQEKVAQTVAVRPDDSLKGQFQKPEQPPIKNEDAIAKSKVDAQRKRQTIPSEYRAKPYSEAEINPPAPPKTAAVQPDETVLDKVRKMWKQEKAQTVHAAPAPKSTDAPKPRKTMSSSFNQAAKKPKGNDFEQGLGHKPDVR